MTHRYSPAADKFNARFLPYAVQSLADWRARHPLKVRAVEPLPIDEHTAAANRTAMNRTPQEQWDMYSLDYLLNHLTE